MFEVWLQMSDTNIDTENPSDLPALLLSTITVKIVALYIYVLFRVCNTEENLNEYHLLNF